MGTEAQNRQQRRSDKKILKDFGIDVMQADIATMAKSVANLANRQDNLRNDVERRHNDLVKQVAKEITATNDLVNELTKEIVGLDMKTALLVEVRNRDIWGRLKWLLTGK